MPSSGRPKGGKKEEASSGVYTPALTNPDLRPDISFGIAHFGIADLELMHEAETGSAKELRSTHANQRNQSRCG